MENRAFPQSGRFNSLLFDDPRKCPIVFRHVSELHRLYRYIYEFYGGQEEVMPDGLTVEILVTVLEDCRIIGSPALSYLDVLRVVESHYPEIRDRGASTSFALNFPITFLEFLELIFEIALSYKSDWKCLHSKRMWHGKKPTMFRGELAEAVDSVILTAQKRPDLIEDHVGNPAIDYDPDFFAMLRGDNVLPKGSRSRGDAGKTTSFDDGMEVLIRSSGRSLPSDAASALLDETTMAEGGKLDKSLLTSHPPNDPSDYEYPDCALPIGSEFLGKVVISEIQKCIWKVLSHSLQYTTHFFT